MSNFDFVVLSEAKKRDFKHLFQCIFRYGSDGATQWGRRRQQQGGVDWDNGAGSGKTSVVAHLCSLRYTNSVLITGISTLSFIDVPISL